MVWFSQQFIDNFISCCTAARDFERVDWTFFHMNKFFTRQNSKYHFLNTETGGNLLTEAIPSAECNKSQKIYSNLTHICYKNTNVLIPN